MIESVEKLRDWSHRYDNSWIQRDGSIMFCTSNSQFAGDGENYGESIRSMIDEIEAEIAERYIELPVDADGVPIRVGDTLQHTKGAWTFKADRLEIEQWGTYVRPNGQARIPCKSCRHVKPRTVEDVLENFAHNYNSIGGKPDEDELWDKLLADTSAELREMLGGDDYKQAFDYWKRMYEELLTEIAARYDVDSMQLIVRCRDCKGYHPGEPCGWCSTHMTAIPREDGFCAWGVPADSDEELSNRGLDEGRKE